MKLISEHYSENLKLTAKIFKMNEKKYRVIVNDDFGNAYNATFENVNTAEQYAEDWVNSYER